MSGTKPEAPSSRRLEVLARQMTAATAGGSVWEHVVQGPPDPILGVSEAFRADRDPRKLNLGVGAYRTEDGKPLVLNVVRKAEQAIINDPTLNHEYLGITGNPDFCRLSRELAFGADCVPVREGRVLTVQSLSGTGALRVGGEFLGVHHAGPKVIRVPNPTWGNHKAVFTRSGLQVKEYRYYKPQTRGLDFEGLIADLRAAEEGSIVLLHACAHNPTGVDPTPEQWRGILAVVQERSLLPFFDMAYQGFASGDLAKDATAVRMFAASAVELLLAQSYAKNMGLYGERIGALSLLCKSADVVKRVDSQVKPLIRPLYSNPPAHGAAIVARVLGDPALLAEWKVELAAMAHRIHDMRTALFNALKERNAPGDWSHILNQIGMFSFTGLTRPQCEHLTRQWHVYLTMDGRISMAGLSAARAGYMADAIVDALRACPQ